MSDQKLDKPRRGFFVVGEMILHAQYAPDTSMNDDILNNWVSALWKQADISLPYTFVSSTSFNQPADRGASTKTSQRQPENPDDNSRPVAEVRAEQVSDLPPSPTSFVHVRLNYPDSYQKEYDDEDKRVQRKDEDIVPIIEKLNNFRNKPIEDSSGITLAEATPNWCLAGSSHSVTDPGSGALPKPVDDTVLEANPGRYLYPTDAIQQAIDEALAECNNDKQQQPVNVVIFDAVPPPGDFDYAFARLLRNNTLLQTLKDGWNDGSNNGWFSVKYASGLSIPLPDNIMQPDPTKGEYTGYGINAGFVNTPVFANNGSYKVSDHGLFIAGIIASFLPAGLAHVYLVETQNNYGAGSIASLQAGIQALMNGAIIPESDRNFPLIVNCSLCVSFASLQELADYCHLKVTDPPDLFVRPPADAAGVAELNSLQTPLCDLLRFSTRGVQIIAASGNDSSNGSNPLPARYPAAFDFVVGVGAIEKGGGRAFYSNLADVPPSEGLMAFGGKANPRTGGMNDTDTTGGGILGLYIGEFPDVVALSRGEPSIRGKKSTNGWAWWAGTSFATAVVSGAFALAASQGLPLKGCGPSAYRNNLKSPKNGKTNDGEPRLNIAQLN